MMEIIFYAYMNAPSHLRFAVRALVVQRHQTGAFLKIMCMEAAQPESISTVSKAALPDPRGCVVVVRGGQAGTRGLEVDAPGHVACGRVLPIAVQVRAARQ